MGSPCGVGKVFRLAATTREISSRILSALPEDRRDKLSPAADFSPEALEGVMAGVDLLIVADGDVAADAGARGSPSTVPDGPPSEPDVRRPDILRRPSDGTR